MKPYRITFQITQEVTEDVIADSAKQATNRAWTFINDQFPSRYASSYDIQVVKVEESEDASSV